MGGEAGKLDQESIDYFKLRERIERAAAEAAATDAARLAHLELADGYAALIRKADKTPA
jgi:hypothetical protein